MSIFLIYDFNEFKYISYVSLYVIEQGRKRPLDTPKRMIERREREEREREKGRRWDIEREGEIKERVRGERDRERERERESKILVKSRKLRNIAQTKVDYTKLSLEIMLRNYQLVYYVAQKWVNQGYWHIQK